MCAQWPCDHPLALTWVISRASALTIKGKTSDSKFKFLQHPFLQDPTRLYHGGGVPFAHSLNKHLWKFTFVLSNAGMLAERTVVNEAAAGSVHHLKGALTALMDTRITFTWAMTSEIEAHPTRKLYLCFKRMPAWVHACQEGENRVWDTPLGLGYFWSLWVPGHSWNRIETHPPTLVAQAS